MSTFSSVAAAVVTTVSLIGVLILGSIEVIHAWGFIGLVLGLPVLVAGILFAPLFVWFMSGDFPVALTIIWLTALASTGYLMVFHGDRLKP